jgi:hypothetical protein
MRIVRFKDAALLELLYLFCDAALGHVGELQDIGRGVFVPREMVQTVALFLVGSIRDEYVFNPFVTDAMSDWYTAQLFANSEISYWMPGAVVEVENMHDWTPVYR